MHHGHPVEAVLFFPNSSVAISAGGNEMIVWDLLSGGRKLHTVSNHQKTITCLAHDTAYTRILTGSLDHHVKVYDVGNYNVMHSIKYTNPILSLALSVGAFSCSVRGLPVPTFGLLTLIVKCRPAA
jgi:U3 small nucleolar RNA-associated protein 15